jgi:DNA-binding NarL/FixJ family response regulator
MGDRLRVGIIDDHPLFREGVVHTLRSARVLDVVGEGGTAEDALRIAKEAA